MMKKLVIVMALICCGCDESNRYKPKPVSSHREYGYLVVEEPSIGSPELEVWLNDMDAKGWKLVDHSHHSVQYVFYKEKPK